MVTPELSDHLCWWLDGSAQLSTGVNEFSTAGLALGERVPDVGTLLRTSFSSAGDMARLLGLSPVQVELVPMAQPERSLTSGWPTDA